jgi:hypothetical protein
MSKHYKTALTGKKLSITIAKVWRVADVSISPGQKELRRAFKSVSHGGKS